MHQCRTSLTTTTLSSSDQPAHGNFILSDIGLLDWRNPQNTNLWQGVNGTNNPCPSGYRIPTETELSAELTSWSTDNAAGAFASPLKLPLAGRRDRSNGELPDVGTDGNYWSSTIDIDRSRGINFRGMDASMKTFPRSNGYSIRCIKN